ncbi:hypothetical protein ACH4D3_02170 [Streptomyces sp. NPDC018026]|uniref:hypothetical protein n=1 Tax=Streptomyces sp. NPDC018026 TaxID=3365031 RepID=UPI00378F98BE
MRTLREHGRSPAFFSDRAVHVMWCPAEAARRTDRGKDRGKDGRFTADGPHPARALA